jgi:hypothetical protein
MQLKSKKTSSKLTIQDWIKLMGFVLIYFFYIKSKDRIINYPSWLLVTVFGIVLVVCIILQYRKIQEHYSKIEKKNKFLFFGINILQIAVIAYFVSGIILIPFNYYAIYSSKTNTLTVENCEIRGISTYSKNRTIFYKFKGKTNVVNGFKPIMEIIKDNGKFKKYYFAAEVKKSICNTYILEGWDIVQKSKEALNDN